MELRFFWGFPRKIEDLLWKYRTSVDWSWPIIAWLMKRNNNSWWKWSWSTLNNNSWTWLESSKSSTFFWFLLVRSGPKFGGSAGVVCLDLEGHPTLVFKRPLRKRKDPTENSRTQQEKTKRSQKTNNEQRESFFYFSMFGLFLDFPTMKNSGQHVIFPVFFVETASKVA